MKFLKDKAQIIYNILKDYYKISIFDISEINLKKTTPIITKCFPNITFNNNQFTALTLLLNYIGEDRFCNSIVKRAILVNRFNQAGINFAFEGRMFAEDMLEGEQIAKMFGKLFNEQ
jgi:hypothetical protein